MPTNTPVVSKPLKKVFLTFSDGTTLEIEAEPGTGIYKTNQYRNPNGKQLLTHEVFIADGSTK